MRKIVGVEIIKDGCGENLTVGGLWHDETITEIKSYQDINGVFFYHAVNIDGKLIAEINNPSIVTYGD